MSGIHMAVGILRLPQARLRRLPFSNISESRKYSLRHFIRTRMRRISGGEDIAYKLRKEVDLMHASPGVFVSSNGKFAENGGVLGVDYFSCPSIRSAIRDKRININFGKKQNQRNVTEQIIRENMDDHGECFIPWTRGGLIAGRMEKGNLIKFNGYMYSRTGNGGKQIVYPSEAI